MKKITHNVIVRPIKEVTDLWCFKEITISTEQKGRSATPEEFEKMLPDINQKLKMSYMASLIYTEINTENGKVEFSGWFYRIEEKEYYKHEERYPNKIYIKNKRKSDTKIQVELDQDPVSSEDYEGNNEKLNDFIFSEDFLKKHIEKIENRLLNGEQSFKGEIFDSKYGLRYNWILQD